MGNDDEALWGRDAAVLLPIEPIEPSEPRDGEPAPSLAMRRSRRRTAVIVAGTIAVVTLAVAVLGRTTRTPTPGEVKVAVRHERFTITIDPALECDPRRAFGPTATQSMVIDTWTDGPRRRVRNTITYPDGSHYDLIATGNIGLPSAAVERGRRADVAVGCRRSDGTPVAVVSPSDLPFALDFSLQVTPEQRSAFAHFHQQAGDAGPVTDGAGHLVTRWTAHTRGTWAVDAGTSLVGHQTWEWWIGRDEPHSVRVQRFTNTVDHLGTAMRIETLDLSQDTMVTAAFFDTTGFHRVDSLPLG
jgi:hypothetical protein